MLMEWGPGIKSKLVLSLVLSFVGNLEMRQQKKQKVIQNPKKLKRKEKKSLRLVLDMMDI